MMTLYDVYASLPTYIDTTNIEAQAYVRLLLPDCASPI